MHSTFSDLLTFCLSENLFALCAVFTDFLCNFVFFCSRCACLMVPPSQGTKPYQARYLSVCCVFRAHISLAGLVRRTPPPTFSDTAVTDRHIDSDTTFPGLLDRKNRTCAAGGSRTPDCLRERRTPYPLSQALR